MTGIFKGNCKDSNMYSCDISSLYASIPTELGIEEISYWLDKNEN